MPPFQDDLRSHAATGAATRLIEILKKSRRKAKDLAQEHREQIESLETAAIYVSQRLRSTQSRLVPADVPQSIAQQLTEAATLLEEFNNSGNVGQLEPAGQHLDKTLRLLAQLPPLAPSEEAEAVAAAFDGARKSVRGYLGGLKAHVNRLEQKAAAAEAKAEEIEADIESQRGRIDSLVTEQQAAFSQMQEQRTTSHSTFLTEQRARFDTQIEAVDKMFADHSKRLEERSSKFDDEIAERNAAADKLLEALGVTSQSAAFLTSATREMWTARTWHGIAMAALFGLVYVAVFQILPSLVGEFDWSVFGARVFVGATLVAAASYAGTQAGKHSRREEYYRNMHLQLAALDPYLARFKTEQRDQIKAELAPTLFKIPASGDFEEKRADLLEEVMKVVLKALGAGGSR